MQFSFFFSTLFMTFTTSIDYRLFQNLGGVPSVTLIEIAALLCLFLYVGRIAFSSPTSMFSSDFTDAYKANKFVFLYFLWATISTTVAIFFRASADIVAMYKNMLPSVVVYFFIVRCITTTKKLILLLNVYLVSVFFQVLLGLCQIFTDGPRLVSLNDASTLKFDLAGDYATNLPTGSFNHPNGLAILLLPPFLFLAIAIFRGLFRGFTKATAIFFLVLVAFVLYRTYAKGVFAWGSIGLVMAFLPRSLRRARWQLGILVLVGGIVGLTTYSIFAAGENANELRTVVTRMYLWMAALNVLSSDTYPLLFGNALHAMMTETTVVAKWEYPNAHNAVINQALFYGVPAAVLYIAFYLRALRSLSTSLLFAYEEAATTISIFLFSALISLLGEYFFEPANVGVSLQTHFFILIGLACSPAMHAISGSRDFVHHGFPGKIARNHYSSTPT